MCYVLLKQYKDDNHSTQGIQKALSFLNIWQMQYVSGKGVPA